MARKAKVIEVDETTEARRRKPSAVTGLQIVEYLARNPLGARLSDIAAALDLDPGLAHRMLGALVSDNWVMPTSDQGSYALTARTIAVGSTYVSRLDLVDHARPFMNELFQMTSESVFLGELRKDRIVCISRKLSDRALTVWTEVGNSWPIEGTAVGNSVVAAQMSLQGLGRDATPLIAIREALETGYARDYGQYRSGVESISCPVLDASGEVRGTISIGGPATRLTEPEIRRLGVYVRDAARGLSQKLGCVDYSFPAPPAAIATPR